MAEGKGDLVPGFKEATPEGLEASLEAIPELEGGLILHLKGRLDLGVLANGLGLCIAAGYTRQVWDLEAVTEARMGEFRLGALLRSIKPRGDLALLNVQPRVYEVFQLIGFSQFFHIKDSLREAIAVLAPDGGTERVAFPREFPCPICHGRITAQRAGRAKCPSCRTILRLDTEGRVSLG